MNGACRAALLAAVAGQLGVLVPSAAAADSTFAAELAQCAAIAAADARLVCYDKLAGRSADRTAPAVASAAAAPPAAAATTIAPAATPPAPPVLPALPAPADDPRNFGLSAAQQYEKPQGPQSIQARIAQVTVNSLRRSYVVLENGQTWTSTEGEMIVDSGELVTIRRAALGSFMLTSASKHSYHVRRIR